MQISPVRLQVHELTSGVECKLLIFIILTENYSYGCRCAAWN